MNQDAFMKQRLCFSLPSQPLVTASLQCCVVLPSAGASQKLMEVSEHMLGSLVRWCPPDLSIHFSLICLLCLSLVGWKECSHTGRLIGHVCCRNWCRAASQMYLLSAHGYRERCGTQNYPKLLLSQKVEQKECFTYVRTMLKYCICFQFQWASMLK